MARPLTLILKTTSLTGLSIILQLLINIVDEDKFGEGKSSSNKTNLSNLSALKNFIGAGYLTSKGAKRGNGNNKKGVKAARGSNYLISGTKNAFNLLRHAFI